LIVSLALVLLSSCHRDRETDPAAAIEFTNVPLAEEGTPNKLVVIAGRVIHARSDQQIVLYARSESTWYVQPLANQPFTHIDADGAWKSLTHPGFDYAALLVGPDFRPPARTDTLPVESSIASAVTKGKPPVWRRWWFLAIDALMVLTAVFAAHRLRVNQLRNQLSLRFEERLAERMRVAQILHDTLLQGVVSASMQLHVAADQLPENSPARAPVHRVLQSMAQVLEEGRNTLRSLQSPITCTHDLEQSFYGVPQELGLDPDIGFRVTVKGATLPLHSNLCGQLYGIGREALVDAFGRCEATDAEVELRYAPREFRLTIRHNGHRESFGNNTDEMIERAAGIGARLEIGNRLRGGAQVRITVPAEAAFESPHSERASIWTTSFRRRRPLLHRADGNPGGGR
jgi:signal transduction histidine kinase